MDVHVQLQEDWIRLLTRYYRWKAGVPKEPESDQISDSIAAEGLHHRNRIEEGRIWRKAKTGSNEVKILRLRVAETTPFLVKIHAVVYQRLILQVNDQYDMEQQVFPVEIWLSRNMNGWTVVSERRLSDHDHESVLAPRIPYSRPGSGGDIPFHAPTFPRFPSSYQRQKAKQYADRWWNGNNPAFLAFEVDCTNYVSQCLYAGGIPMHMTGNRHNGWWYQGNGSERDRWSLSWAVAHSLRWYLASRQPGGIQAEEVTSADQLMVGDVICYDFDGDGTWQHNTIVTAKDGNGMPLVNAHTGSSYRRYWDYHDSYAWTERIQYKFFHILS